MCYLVLAYYLFTEIENPEEEVRKQKKFFENRDVTGRIYLSKQGINGQMSGSREDALAYMEWLKEDERFREIEFKVHLHKEQAFPRMTVKSRKQLVALDLDVDLSKKGSYLSPQEWSEMLEKKDENTLLIDIRNDYETEIGHFEGSLLPPCETFREFPAFTAKLAQEVDAKNTKVMMCCTGGIRCELYSAVMKEQGFKEVYQLQGGIIKYGQEVGSKHFEGKLFVFDDRLSVPLDKENSTTIASCHLCSCLSDTYYNCANMDCNKLFLACKECLDKLQGCCCPTCQTATRLRPYHQDGNHKPFRRSHLINNICNRSE